MLVDPSSRPSPRVLNATELATALRVLPGWQLNQSDGAWLKRIFTFKSFEDAMRFMQLAVPEIARLNHHPDWRNNYKTLEVALTTFDRQRQITELDIALAKVLDSLFATFS